MTLKLYQLSESSKTLLRTGHLDNNNNLPIDRQASAGGLFRARRHVYLNKNSLPEQALSEREQFLDDYLTNCYLEWSQWLKETEYRIQKLKLTANRAKRIYDSTALHWPEAEEATTNSDETPLTEKL